MKITVAADRPIGTVKQYWTKCVGSCHAATALRADWRRQLRTCRQELGEGITILVANHQIPGSPISAETIGLHVSGAQGIRSAYLERIDESHANPRQAWVEMGRPTYLDRAQIQALMKASELHSERIDWTADERGVSIDLSIEPHSVVSVSMEC